jgi:large subunit ribosomal protein L17
MKHRVAGRKLGRTSAHRLAVLRNLSTDLFRHERIQTTLMKAKELRPFAERLITVGKRADVHARRRLARHIRDSVVAKKLVETIATRFAERPGGYTRILKLGPRRGDSAEMAIVELIGSEPTFAPKEETKKERKGGLGRIRERLSRRKAAPAEAGEAAEAGGEAGSAEASAKKSAGKPAKAAAKKKGGAKAKPAGAKPARAAKGGPGKSAAKKGGAGRKQGGQSPKKGG